MATVIWHAPIYRIVRNAQSGKFRKLRSELFTTRTCCVLKLLKLSKVQDEEVNLGAGNDGAFDIATRRIVNVLLTELATSLLSSQSEGLSVENVRLPRRC